MSVALSVCDTSSWSQREQNEIPVLAGATKTVPPDRGYGWTVAGACFFITFLFSGFLKSFSSLEVAIFQEFPGTTPSVAAWIPGLLGTLSLVLSPVTGVLTSYFSYRALVCVGGLLCCTGLASSYLATSAFFLVASIGGLMGVGASLAVTTVSVCSGKHFTTRRPAAMAVALSGSCFGTIVLPTAISELLRAVGLRYTFLVLAGVFSLLIICGLLFSQSQRRGSGIPSSGSNRALVVISLAAGDRVLKSSLKAVVRRQFLRFLTDGLFLLTTASIFVMGLGNSQFLDYVPEHASSLGIEKSSAMLLLAYSTSGDVVVRLLYGLLASHSPLPRTAEYIAAVSVSAGAIISLPYCSRYCELVVASVAAGVATGVWTMVVPLLLSSNHGVESMTGTVTLVRLFQGVAYLVYPPVAGALLSLAGDQALLLFMGCKVCIASALAVALHFATTAAQRRREAAISLRQRLDMLTDGV